MRSTRGMSSKDRKRCEHHGRELQDAESRFLGLLGPCIRFGTIVTGVLALLWLITRSGTRPSRLSYPCQQAAFSTAALAFGAPLVAAVVSMRGRLGALMRTGYGKMAAAGLCALCAVMLAVASGDPKANVAMLQPPPDYHPDIYLITHARGIEPGRHGGVDDLITLMGEHDLKLHRSATTGDTSGSDGLIDADDVVLIKVNGQWSQRGGTNTDVLRGVIRRIVEHPDGFVGEIVVGENTQHFQFDLDHDNSNAEDRITSIQEVVDDFYVESWDISTERWDTYRSLSVNEYSDGDTGEGYVVNPVADPETEIRVSYPKFQSTLGTYISYKYGVWSPASQTYDPDKLVVINIPVFKTHATYGITASVKNHMGVVTTRLDTASHLKVATGGMGTILAEVRMPDLNILDCIWILARSHDDEGPAAPYAAATRRGQLLAGTDPVALDVWATKFIMMPQIIENGYTYDDYHTRQDPDNPLSKFRTYIDLSMNEMLAAGIDTTNDYNAVNLYAWDGVPVPTVSQWGMVVLTLLLVTAGSVVIRRRRTVVVG